MIRTLEEKQQAVRARREEERQLSAAVIKLERSMGEDVGCGGPLCAWVSRWRGRAPAVSAAAAGAVAGAAVGKAVNTAESVGQGIRAQSALFGQRKTKQDPAGMLQAAAEAMEQRVEQLESRVGAQRAEAARLMQAGQKGAALRALKKSKALEKQLASNQQSLLAVEQQVDMLSQAHLQRTMADALHASSKGLKKDKKLLKRAEGAVEEAQEARDLAEDLGQVMADFASPGDDDDELLAELEGMTMVEEDPVPPEVEMTEQQRAMASLAAKHAAYDEAERVRRGLPSAPGKKEERAGLLAAAVSS